MKPENRAMAKIGVNPDQSKFAPNAILDPAVMATRISVNNISLPLIFIVKKLNSEQIANPKNN